MTDFHSFQTSPCLLGYDVSDLFRLVYYCSPLYNLCMCRDYALLLFPSVLYQTDFGRFCPLYSGLVFFIYFQMKSRYYTNQHNNELTPVILMVELVSSKRIVLIQRDVLPIECSLWPTIANNFMQWFEEQAIEPKVWFETWMSNHVLCQF